MNSNNLLNNKIFRLVITVSLIVSILAIIGNIIVGFPFAINIKWIIWVIISVVSLILDKRTNSNKYIKTFFFSFIVYILIPLGWFDSGGTNNNTIAYVFLIMFCIAVLFKGKERIVLTLSLIAIFILLLITDYYYPDLLRVYSEESQFFDRLIQIPLTLLCGFLLVKTFSDAYNNEVAKEQNYALKLEKANNQLEFLSNHDSLSFLYNRRAFDQKVKSVLQEKDFHSKYIIMIDIDNFKEINDLFGHDLGDDCIKHIAEKGKEIFPSDTFFSRWGGDEFAFIFSGERNELIKTLDEFLTSLNQYSLNETLFLAASIGAAKVDCSNSLNDLVKKADDIMYTAKNKGGNKYLID